MPFQRPHKPNIDVKIVGQSLLIRDSTFRHHSILISDAIELAYYVHLNEIELLSKINENEQEQRMNTDGDEDDHNGQ